MKNRDEFSKIHLWREFHGSKFIAWVSWYEPLDLYSQGLTRDKAFEACREMVLMWAELMMTDKAGVRTEKVTEPDRVWNNDWYDEPTEEK